MTWIGPWLDKGEAAMAIAIKEDLAKYVSNINVTACTSSFYPDDIDVSMYGQYNIRVIPGLIPAIIFKISKFKFLKFKSLKLVLLIPFFLLHLIHVILWQLLYKSTGIDLSNSLQFNKDLINMYKDSDVIILCGGQNITNLNITTLIAFYEILYSRMMNKSVMIWANSMGPFEPNYIHPLARWVLNRVNLITTREATSKAHLDRIGVNVPLFVTADAAFTLPAISSEEALKLISKEMEIPINGLMVGITAIAWNFPGEKNSAKKLEDYLDALAGTADYIIKQYNSHIIFFPQVIVPNIKDDRLISMRIFDKIKEKSKVTILTKDYSPEQLKGMYGCMSLLIGTRFHSCILAQSMHVPTIAIEYDGHKAFGIMKLLELENYVININAITVVDLISKVNEVYSNRNNIKEVLKKNIEIMQADSRKNTSLAIKYLNLKSE